MKLKSLLPLLVMLLSVTVSSAQWDVVRETERMMSFGSRPCFRMEFANTDVAVIESVWKDFAKKNFAAKLKKSKGEWTATKLRSAFMGDSPYALYSTIEKDGDKAALNVWVDAGSYFLNRRENRGRTEEMARSLQQCYFDIRRASIGKELKMAEDKLKELEGRQKKLQKDNESLRKDIESWKSKIQKAEQDIVNNEQSQESNIVDQEAQRRLVEEVRRRLENVENEGGN
jgi:hypothetical protein